jgi:transcriptional regulator with PAS, ATPase and Fis domain
VGESLLSILGVSPPIVALRAWLPKVARSNATVLITGETGTGKERVARAVHDLSARAHGPFVALNCAALPDGLVESELFGHARGAFTGAHFATRGQMQQASGGTLFLDEIGDMPLSTQAKLLRAIEARSVHPVGGAAAIPVDLRVVAATNQQLETMVERGRFRQDLYYRLNVARIELPPLRERSEDVPVLLDAAIAELNAREHEHVGLPDHELLNCLLAHDWPGNVRELRNLAEALFIDPPRGQIRFADLPPAFARLLAPHRQSVSDERERLIEALTRTHWNKAQTAKALNWSRMTIYRKLAQHKLGCGP